MNGSAGTDSGIRERILAAAAATLSAKGHSHAYLTDIAQLAQVQPPALYHYFDSRDDLIKAVMQHGQRLVREHVCDELAALPTGTGIDERMSVAVEAHLRVELELSDFARAVTRNAGQLPAHIRAEFEADSEAFHDVWRNLLAQAQAEGATPPRNRPDGGPDVSYRGAELGDRVVAPHAAGSRDNHHGSIHGAPWTTGPRGHKTQD